MANPVFIHIVSDGKVFASIDRAYLPPVPEGGSVLGSFRVNSSCHSRQIGTVSIDAGNLAVADGTGLIKELV